MLQQGRLRFSSQPQPLPAVCPLSGYLTSLNVKFSHLLNTDDDSTYHLLGLFRGKEKVHIKL